MRTHSLKRWWWVILVATVCAVLLPVAGLAIWASGAAEPMPEALAALEPGDGVQVQTEPWLIFQPQDSVPETGVIFYPGGGVDPRAYAPQARALAEKGYLVVIPPMPFHLAVLAPNRAADVIAAYPEIRRWAIGGHSLGGVMAASFALKNPETIGGLFLWASYPADSDDLSGHNLAVTSVYGTLDGLASPETVEAARPRLPVTTSWVPIQGGNHAQFGWYGDQEGDNPATISREEQQAQALAAVEAMLASMK